MLNIIIYNCKINKTLHFSLKKKDTFIKKKCIFSIKYVNVMSSRKHIVLCSHHPKDKRGCSCSKDQQVKNKLSSSVKSWDPKTVSKLAAPSTCPWNKPCKNISPMSVLFRRRLSNPNRLNNSLYRNKYRTYKIKVP